LRNASARLNSTDETHGVAVHLLETMIKTGRNAAIVSPITALELLIRPLRTAPAGAIHFHDFLGHTPNLTLMPIDLHVASLRATHNQITMPKDYL